MGVNIIDLVLTNGSSLEMGIIDGSSITSSLEMGVIDWSSITSFEDESLRVWTTKESWDSISRP